MPLAHGLCRYRVRLLMAPSIDDHEVRAGLRLLAVGHRLSPVADAVAVGTEADYFDECLMTFVVIVGPYFIGLDGPATAGAAADRAAISAGGVGGFANNIRCRGVRRARRFFPRSGCCTTLGSRCGAD
jgi:hypothetical protein